MAGKQIPAKDTLGSIAKEDHPVLEAVALMHLDTLASCGLDERTYHLVRLAALVAADAPPISYVANLGAAADAGVRDEDAQDVLIAIAPIVGSARITAAAGNVLRGLGLVAAVGDGA